MYGNQWYIFSSAYKSSCSKINHSFKIHVYMKSNITVDRNFSVCLEFRRRLQTEKKEKKRNKANQLNL